MAKRSRSKQRRSSRVADATPDAVDATAASEEKATDNDNDSAIPSDDNVQEQELETNDAIITAATPTKNPNKLEQVWDNVQSSLTDNLLPFLGPEELLATLLLNNNNDASGDSSQQQQAQAAKQRLVTTSQYLFRYIEHLAQMEEHLKEMQKLKKMKALDSDAESDEEEKEEEHEVQPCTLSGIPSLYTGQEEEDVEPVPVDAETIWGQVDLQNNALLPRLKKLIKKLAKRTNNAAGANGDDDGEGKYSEDDLVRVLDTGAMMMGSDDDNDDEESDDEDSDDDGDILSDEGSAASDFDPNNQDEEEDEEQDSDEDSEALRIRKRMEKTMADMSDDDDDNQSDEDDMPDEKQQKIQELAAAAASLESSIIDPTREEMRDGFFDLHEMEAFADEEEEMLPDDAYGMEETAQGDDDDEKSKKKKKKAVLPHLKDRMAANDSGSENEDGDDDDEEDEEDELSKRFQPTTVRRKKYRADDEVDALYNMYDNEEESDESDEEEGGASTLTAADFFGKPNNKLIKKYKAKHGGKKKDAKSKDSSSGSNMKTDGAKKKAANGDDDDADSWDNHDFEEDGMDWKGADGDKGGEDDDNEEDAGSEEDQNDEEDNGNGEEEMNDIVANIKKSTSKHALHSEKLKEQTLQLELDLMAEKPWKMMGEAKGSQRQTDSLLDSTPEFEVAFKPPPILTAEHTASIDEMIKKRILDEDWDDVVPRELPDIGIKRGGDAPEVSQEKSKLGLGELYEREYLKKATGYDRDADEKQTEEDAAKEEMKELFAHLCSQLDALSNYHFAPRPVADEADVQNKSEDGPAIAMEEVLPLHVSGSRGRAPEEIYGAGKGKESVLKGETEMDQAERRRLRNSKKATRRKARKHKHADEKLISKLQPGLGLNNPYEKRKLREELQMARASGKVVVASDNKKEWLDEAADGKEYRTSTKFFQKMQENVESAVKGDEDGNAKKKRKGPGEGQSSSVYRL
mmetsp:Transcript_30818/g.65123  ORF Transcript_30818/g.65123 Transcript_30818/m.65123 type:complete len:970 (-) Transcript_30818:73-2982(-)|eukprot:CAMPEP_0172321972 /NCGR_PEP_ID=MMETSP1058-20130122/44730_1 /TAXON_ID=83371 /ORGANISM="Detonula confervacea, Strain CCMP 353" /LENGTH=969 /DNA_ID=CAMNT_0013037599 /DNA_START=32 /DNA_END=2941 /DNA_ORIENTATION=-